MEGQLLTIYYDRVISSEEIELTPENCNQYGYLSTTKKINDIEYVVYYKQDESPENYIMPIIDESTGLATTTILYEQTKRYTHIAPACSSFDINYADVDKEGSGRNDSTGEMIRERLGSYCKVDLTWDLIPNSKEYNNWWKILTHLPTNFYAELLMPSGAIETIQFYRADVSTKLYVFVADRQIWQGLSTSFIQWNLTEINDDFEPELEEI